MNGFRLTRLRGLTIATMVVATTLFGTPAHSFERVAEGVEFHIKCFGLMISKPKEHVTVCNPVFRDDNTSLVQGGSVAAAPAPAPAPPLPAPAPPKGFI